MPTRLVIPKISNIQVDTRLGLDAIPAGAAGLPLVGQGAGVDPAYSGAPVLTSPTIQGSVVAGTGLTMPSFTLPDAATIISATSIYSYIKHDAAAWDIFTKAAGNSALSRLRIPSGTDVVTIALANANLLFGHNMAIQANAANGTIVLFQAYEAGAYVTLASMNSSATAATWNFSRNVGIGITPIAPLHIYSAADLGFGVSTVIIEADNTGYPNQLMIRGKTVTNKRLYIGYETTLDYGSIQVYQETVGSKPLTLNPLGGQVGIGVSPANTLHVRANDAITNAVVDILRLDHLTTGVAADGIGTGLILYSEDASGNIDEAGSIDAVFTTAAHATQAGAMVFSVMGAEVFRISNLGAATIALNNTWLPANDQQWSIGSDAKRLLLVRAVTVTSGDFRFENGYYFTEAEKFGKAGIAMVRPDNSLVEVFS